MPKAKNASGQEQQGTEQGITRIIVAGFKSISEEQSIEVKPLTILAGANSTGKSSIMQPLLLMKQTLEATYDPGALKLDGPNVYFTAADQFLSNTTGKPKNELSVGIELSGRIVLTSYLGTHRPKGLEVQKTRLVQEGHGNLVLQPGMSHDELTKIIPKYYAGLARQLDYKAIVARNRCFLEVRLQANGIDKVTVPLEELDMAASTSDFEASLQGLIHVPALRGNPLRAYPLTAVGDRFSGTFDTYTASVVLDWQEQFRPSNVESVGNDLKRLGLTWNVVANRLNDTQVELKVDRLPEPTLSGAHNLVSIADVGFAVSQTLPLVVALYAAKRGQLVYLEQPEIHLHPRAQTKMAEVIRDAVVQRDVKVVVETHSNLLLLGIQTLVAEGKFPPELVKLHWFTRRKDGSTQITSADLDETGAFGDWPEDFGEVELEADNRYLSAVEESRMRH